MKVKSLIGAMAALVCLSASMESHAGIISEWNLIVRNDLHTTSEVDGSALIGGSVLGTSNYSVHSVTASNGDGLAVGGNIGAGINVQVNSGGNFRHSGSVLGTVNVNGGSTIFDANVPTMVSNAFAEIEANSASYAALTPNGSMSGSGHFSASPVNIDGFNVAVYSINQDDFQSFGQITLTIGSADTVIINVAADVNGVVDFRSPPNILSDFTQANSHKILWNCYNATTVLSNNTFNGALLAPFADLQLTGGGMNGSIAVNNVSVMNAEVRAKVFTGYVPPIPEPGTMVLLACGAVALSRRRK